MRPRGRGDARQGRSARAAAPATRGGLAALRDQLSGVIEPVARHAGLDVEQVAVSRIGRRHSVRVVVDHDEGVGLDTIAEVSREFSAALDAADEAGEAVVPGEYVLEVTSPGVDRPLTEPRHWRRNRGRLVTVTGPAGRLTGRIRAATDEQVVLEVDGAPQELSYSELGPGQVQVELQSVGDEADHQTPPEETGADETGAGAPSRAGTGRRDEKRGV